MTALGARDMRFDKLRVFYNHPGFVEPVVDAERRRIALRLHCDETLVVPAFFALVALLLFVVGSAGANCKQEGFSWAGGRICSTACSMRRALRCRRQPRSLPSG